MLHVAIVVAVIQIMEMWPAVGWHALFGYITIGGLGFHTYDVILYPFFALTILRKIWGEKFPWALFAIWGTNECVFNTAYSMMYPGSVGGILHITNITYMGLMITFVIVGYMNMRPKKLVYGVGTFVFPFFVAVWAYFGMPLIVPYPTYIPHFGAWPWEVAYQISLFTSFICTVRPAGTGKNI
jgi:hypothetical protein